MSRDLNFSIIAFPLLPISRTKQVFIFILKSFNFSLSFANYVSLFFGMLTFASQHEVFNSQNVMWQPVGCSELRKNELWINSTRYDEMSTPQVSNIKHHQKFTSGHRKAPSRNMFLITCANSYRPMNFNSASNEHRLLSARRCKWVEQRLKSIASIEYPIAESTSFLLTINSVSMTIFLCAQQLFHSLLSISSLRWLPECLFVYN